MLRVSKSQNFRLLIGSSDLSVSLVECLRIVGRKFDFAEDELRYNWLMAPSSGFHDTTQEAESVLIRMLRAKPAPARLSDAVAASNRVAQQCKEAIRRRHPELSDQEIGLRFIEINYGRELASKVRTYLSNR